MRLAALVSLLSLALGVALAGCGGSARVSTQVVSGEEMRHPTSSGMLVEPRTAADSACNGGRGVSLAEKDAPITAEQWIATTGASNGSVLIAYNAGRAIVIQSLTSQCQFDKTFGRDGTATVTRPGGWLSVEAIAARNGGGAVLAGLYRDHAAVAEVDRRGRVVHTFGRSGQALFPFCAEPTDVLQEPSGRIIVAGDSWMGVNCAGNWAAAMFPDGRYDGGFGHHGVVALPTLGADSGVDGLTRPRGGNLLVQIGYGNSGCWGYTLRLLAPSGWTVPFFVSRFERFWQKLHFHAFTGSVYASGRGFTLVGTGQKPCWVGGPLHSRSATGLVVHFRSNGRLAGALTRFASGMHAALWSVPMGADTIVASAPYGNETSLALIAVRPDGSLDSRFGNDGRVSIRTRWRGQDAGLEAALSVTKAGSGGILILAADIGHHELRAIRIRP